MYKGARKRQAVGVWPSVYKRGPCHQGALGEAAPGDHRLDVRSRVYLTCSEARAATTPPPSIPDGKAGLLHQPEKRGKAVGFSGAAVIAMIKDSG